MIFSVQFELDIRDALAVKTYEDYETCILKVPRDKKLASNRE